MIDETAYRSTQNTTLGLVAVLGLVFTGLGVYIAYLEYQGNALEDRRQRPSVQVHVSAFDVPKHTEEVDVAALIRDLSALEERHSRYSGLFILAALHGLETESAGVPSREEIGEMFTGISERVESTRTERVEFEGDLSSLLSQWRRLDTVSQDQLSSLTDVEMEYSGVTGNHILELIGKVEGEVNSGGDESERLRNTIGLLETVVDEVDAEAPAMEAGYSALLEDLEALEAAYAEGKEIHRLTVEVIAENQSQLPTVIRKEALIGFRDSKKNLRLVVVEANEDLNLGPYSVGRGTFVASSLDSLDPLDVDVVTSGDASLACRVAVVDLRNVGWTSEWSTGCRDDDPGGRHELAELRGVLSGESTGGSPR
ncbi:MAG: hypothetical protein F4Y16_02610 [Holophagales bacterium]|nr:hypothetical protein [Holophagales bacterium]MYH25022.1 hypothetical protein [Holophagales bacterium]